jgi:hypothetical protein
MTTTSLSTPGGGGGGGLVSHVALAVIDTRVILGALFGWTLFCRVSIIFYFLKIGGGVE